MNVRGVVLSGCLVACGWISGSVVAQTVVHSKRPIPVTGIEVPAEVRNRLEGRLSELRQAIDQVVKSKNKASIALLPDVEIFHKAVADALKYQEIYKEGEFKTADSLLDEGMARAADLLNNRSPWTEATGLVVRGYVSKLDGSVQPYGLVVPSSYTHRTAGRYRLDFWFHGRGDNLTEMSFIQGRRGSVGQFAPEDTIVLHPYGRFCNAFKFAGEVDALEALEAVRSAYRVDNERIGVRGFSMGGAATWHFAAHYSDRWYGANPGAGFAETAKYLNVFGSGGPIPPWYEQRLWRLYDCPPLAPNLSNCPLVAYSGELDKQKAAADLMAAALEKEGIEMMHIIGPNTEHRYEPQAAAEVERRMTALARLGRLRVPNEVYFVTSTLKYPKMHWVEVEGLKEHWSYSYVEASFDQSGPIVAVQGVTDLRLHFEPGEAPLPLGAPVNILIEDESADSTELKAPGPASDLSWDVRFHRVGKKWQLGARPSDGGLRKRHNLQGPIDDAFMDSFVFVMPSGTAAHPAVQKWVDEERARAVESWRRTFRGVPRVKLDREISDDDIQNHHLVLWGDPSSNELLKRVADKLPIAWNRERISLGDESFRSAGHVLLAIYPNPLNPARYVVLNSSFTFREAGHTSNARQTPKLPDWAVIDLSTPPDLYTPGRVVAADFFDEQWRLRPDRRPVDSSEVE